MKEAKNVIWVGGYPRVPGVNEPASNEELNEYMEYLKKLEEQGLIYWNEDGELCHSTPLPPK